MVRLVVLTSLVCSFISFVFQFLYGAIGGILFIINGPEPLLFQFLYGAIGGRYTLYAGSSILHSFNSYMVRLVA